MKTQHGFINGGLIIVIALIALIVGAVALATNTDQRDISTDEQRASATVVIKRVADLVEAHKIKVAEGEVHVGEGFAQSMSADVAEWPKQAFVGQTRGEAVDDGTVTYITGITEEFCKSLNDVLQVSGIPTSEQAPADRVSCVLAPESN